MPSFIHANYDVPAAGSAQVMEPNTNSVGGGSTIQGPAYTLPVASATVLGGIKIGANLSIDNTGTLNAPAPGAGGGGGGSAVDDVAFSTTVPLLNTAGTHMIGVTAVTGPLVFTPMAGAVRGAYTFLGLKANGVNIPDFSAFTKHESSSDYNNTANILNIIEFFNLVGTNWYSISHAADPVPIVAPTVVTLTGPTSGVVNTASANYTVGTDGVRPSPVLITPTPVANVVFNPTSITLPAGTGTGTFTATSASTGNKTIAVGNNASLANPAPITLNVIAAATAPDAMAAPVATAGVTSVSLAFVAPTANGSAITSYDIIPYLAGVAQSAINITTLTSPTVVSGLTAGSSYTFAMRANNGVGNGAYSPQSNAVTPTAAVNADRFGALLNVTETGTGPYSYAGGAEVWDNPNGGIYGKKFAANTDGSIKIRVDAYSVGAANFVMLGLTLSATPVGFGSLPFYVYTNSSSSAYTGNIGTLVNTIVPAAGDIMWLKRVGTAHTLSISKDGGGTFVDAWQFTATANAYNIECIPNKGGAWTTVSSTGLV